MTYISENFDFHDAISLYYNDVDITSIYHLTNNCALVKTNVGNFVCETFRHFETGDVLMIFSTQIM
jgi:hypothetical protein